MQQVCLGRMYEVGEFVSQNYALAAKWYRKAAEHVPNRGGAGVARNNLGLLQDFALILHTTDPKRCRFLAPTDTRQSTPYKSATGVPPEFSPTNVCFLP